MVKSAPPLLSRMAEHAGRCAIVDRAGEYSYRELDGASARAAGWLLDGRAAVNEARVAFLVTPGFEWAATLLGIWRAGGVAVPLAVSHPRPELEYAIREADADTAVADDAFREQLEPLASASAIRFGTTRELLRAHEAPAPDLDAGRRALMFFTSGTTGKPKGVIHTHASLTAQMRSLVTAWEWSAHDRVLLVLPLHHVHGVVNVVCCALWAGAVCEMQPRFDAHATWERLGSGALTLFMAVPTVYHRLIDAWEAATPEDRRALSRGCRALRLMVSGSAALPVRTLDRWAAITGHVLLERYGMTEIGMALSNPLHGERRPGFVGTPLPGVSVRLVDEQGGEVPEGTPGEIEVRGPNLFLEYWRRPESTERAFRDGWFRTGDVAVVERGAFRILGRNSVDIIKTGGFKVSALEIEEVLRTHPAIAECAVVGVPDETWGERICAAVELRPGAALALDLVQGWARERLAPYKLPRDLRCVNALPRNALGKVVKVEVASLFEGRPA